MIHFTKLYLKNHKKAFAVSAIMLLLTFFLLLRLVSVYFMKAEYAALQSYNHCIQFIPDYNAFITEEYKNVEEQQRAETQIYYDFINRLKKLPAIKDIYYSYRGVTGLQEADGDSLFLCNSRNSPGIKTDELKSGSGFSDNEREVILVSGKTKLNDTINIEGSGGTDVFKVVGVLKNSVLAIDTGELVDFSAYKRNVYLLNPVFYDKQEIYEAGMTALYLDLLDNATIDDVKALEQLGELREIQVQEYKPPLDKLLIFVVLAGMELVLSCIFSRYKRDYMWKVIYNKPLLCQIVFFLLKDILPVFIGLVFILLVRIWYTNHNLDYKVFCGVILLYIVIRLSVETLIFLGTKNSYLMKLRNPGLLQYACAYQSMLLKDWLQYIVWEYDYAPEQYVDQLLFDLQMEKYADIPLWKVEQVVLLKLECYILRAWKNVVCNDEFLSRNNISEENRIQIINFMDRTV